MTQFTGVEAIVYARFKTVIQETNQEDNLGLSEEVICEAAEVYTKALKEVIEEQLSKPASD